MKFRKIGGWLLLVVGLAIIGWALFFSYKVFTGEIEPPTLFQFEQNNDVAVSQAIGMQITENQIKEMIGAQLGGMIPLNAFPKLLNLAAWLLLAVIFIMGGSQIATLGIKLLKD